MGRTRSTVTLVQDMALAHRVRALIDDLGVKGAMHRLGVGYATLQDARSGTMALEARARVVAALEGTK
jgi:hypothetical protein